MPLSSAPRDRVSRGLFAGLAGLVVLCLLACNGFVPVEAPHQDRATASLTLAQVHDSTQADLPAIHTDGLDLDELPGAAMFSIAAIVPEPVAGSLGRRFSADHPADDAGIPPPDRPPRA